jgi:hypothetical protein
MDGIINIKLNITRKNPSIRVVVLSERPTKPVHMHPREEK